MNFGFKMLNPLITSKLLEDSKSQELIKFSVLLDKTTEQVIQQIENEKGKNVYQGKIDLQKMFTGFPGSMIKKKLEKACPDAEKILLEMDYTNEVLNIVYLDKENKIITHNQHH
jgi:hypothetical protein